uniref:N-acetyltransferase domain-containing protein n=1 Tax=Cannabis sativa TaxID=3483 RepID=A0A803P254_CANSA
MKALYGRNNVVDFVTFSVKYGCWTQNDTEGGWSKSELPLLNIDSDTQGKKRITQVVIDTRFSTRWTLAINFKEIEDFALKDAGSSDELVPVGGKSSVDGWHTIQFSGQKAPTKASQVVDLFPTVSPEIVVREARLEDCWEVAETHCSSFFPDSSLDETFLLGTQDLKIGGFDGKISLNKGYVTGILTVDTVADFLLGKDLSGREGETGIAYISNVAVREKFRRKGIAKQLVAKAESHAQRWGCRAIALHCDLNNPGATKLYKSQGFRSIKVPDGAAWPQPKTSPDVKFNFMMKLLNNSTTA